MFDIYIIFIFSELFTVHGMGHIYLKHKNNAYIMQVHCMHTQSLLFLFHYQTGPAGEVWARLLHITWHMRDLLILSPSSHPLSYMLPLACAWSTIQSVISNENLLSVALSPDEIHARPGVQGVHSVVFVSPSVAPYVPGGQAIGTAVPSGQ